MSASHVMTVLQGVRRVLRIRRVLTPTLDVLKYSYREMHLRLLIM